MSGLKFANRGLPDHTQINAALAEVKRLTAEVERLKAELAATRSNFRALVDLSKARDLRDDEGET